MMNGSEMESLLGMAIARMELAQRDALTVFENMYAHLIDDAERKNWLNKLLMAHVSLDYAESLIFRAAEHISPTIEVPRGIWRISPEDFLQTLRGVQAELDAFFSDTTDLEAIVRANALVRDVIAKAEGRTL